MEFKEYTIDKFTKDLARDLSSPGGGSTAALVISLAASLNSMVYSFTIDKKAFENLEIEKKEEMKRLYKESNELITESLKYMEYDRDSFMALMDCFKLKKNTEEEKALRSKEIALNTKKAMEVPFNLAKIAIKFYDNIEFAIKYGNKNLTSDAIVSAILLHSSIEAAVINVIVNFNSLEKKEEYGFIKKECNEIIEESSKRKEKIVNDFTSW